MTAKRLRVRIGPSFDKDSQRTITVNDESNPVRIESDHFSGFVWFRVHNFKGVSSPLPSASSPLATSPNETEPVIPDSKYFEGKRRYFSLEFRGWFKKSWTANDIEFGIVLARKIRLPLGADLGLRIAQAIDPGLRADLNADEPWTMSPLLCAMNIFNVGFPTEEPGAVPTTEITKPRKPKSSSVSSSAHSLPESPIRTEAKDDGCELVRLGSEVESKLSLGSSVFTPGSSLEESNTLTKHGHALSSEARKKYFLDENHRKAFQFSPEYTYGFDFYNRYLDLGEMRIRLPGFSIDMVKYWDEGLAIRYVCRSKDASAIFFVVELDLV